MLGEYYCVLKTLTMLRHFLVLTLRNFRRNKTAFFINLVGLSTGLACVLLIYLWVNDELSVDKFHENDTELYAVKHNLEVGGGIMTLRHSPTPLAAALVEEMPEVEMAVAVNDLFHWRNNLGLLIVGDQRLEAKGLIASKDYFKVFSYPLTQGDAESVLADKNGVVISSELAVKLFGSTENIIGQQLEWNHTGFSGPFQVSGIFEAPPANSTVDFDVVFHLDMLLDNDEWAGNWTNGYAENFLVLKEGTDLPQFNAKIKDLMVSKDPLNKSSTLFAQQYSKQYLYGRYENGQAQGDRIIYIRLFSLIAIMILLIACVNFMNLSTAKASLKMKEIGVKKAIGASRASLIKQFIGESMILSFLGLLLASQIVILLLPLFNKISAKEIELTFTGGIISAFLGITLLTGLLAGSYPALYLSGFKPVKVLKGQVRTSWGELWVRKGLVVFQFALSLAFIVGLLVINEQVKYVQSKDMGYERDNVITFKWKGEIYDNWSGLGEEGKSNSTFYSFVDQVRTVPGVEFASNISYGNILDNIAGQSGASWSGQDTDASFQFKSPVVGYDFIETLGIELAAGRSFSPDYSDNYYKVVLNETAIDMMGFEDPVGKTFRMNGGDCEIIGVVKDFHYGSLYNAVEPFIFRFDINGGILMAKIKSGTTKNTLARIEKLHSEFLPGSSFEYSFLDQDYKAQYESEIRVATLSKYFAGLAIIISCLGLFGLATFLAERRKKEIGIRKVLGSSVIGIVQLLSSDFTKTVLIAVAISAPASYLLSSYWLANFADSIQLNLWFFILPSLLVLFIAWCTVSLQTIRAAQVNPVICLKEE